jgi:cytochrome c oxidase assembly factor CtaG
LFFLSMLLSGEPAGEGFTGVQDALVHGWTFPPYLTFFSLLAVVLYLRGWRRGHTLRPAELPPWRAACFCSGILSFWLAIASPIGAFDDVFLTAHMVQHLILMSVAPPLILLGAPSVPLLRGLPRAVIRGFVGPLLRLRVLRHIGNTLFHPVTGWLALNIAYLGWHIPTAYELALRSDSWHEVEHACFFFTSVLFWWTVLQPWPHRSVWSRWAVIPYLLTADFVNTGLSAFFAFSGRVLYPSYASQPHAGSISPLDDQVAAGAFMWVVGSLLYLVPAVATVFHAVNSRSVRLSSPVQRTLLS